MYFNPLLKVTALQRFNVAAGPVRESICYANLFTIKTIYEGFDVDLDMFVTRLTLTNDDFLDVKESPQTIMNLVNGAIAEAIRFTEDD